MFAEDDDGELWVLHRSKGDEPAMITERLRQLITLGRVGDHLHSACFPADAYQLVACPPACSSWFIDHTE